MRAVTVEPGVAESVALTEVDEPPVSDGPVLVRTLAVGVCGTDREILEGHYGTAPQGHRRLVLGHESLGEVLEAPAESGLNPGDLVVALVRHPDPVPCPNCAIGQVDMCRNGRYTERGIKGCHGFAAERFRTRVEQATPVDRRLAALGVLVEPASVIAKAWDQIDRIGVRSRWTPRRVLVTGAGPIGLLAALFAADRGLEVHVLDRATAGPKPQLVRDLGANYHTGPVERAVESADVFIECTGAGELFFAAMRSLAPNGIACLTGLSTGPRAVSVDAAGLNRELVLENNVVFGTVSANRLHYELAAEVLARADAQWLDRLVTRRVPLRSWRDAYTKQRGDVKVVLEFAA